MKHLKMKWLLVIVSLATAFSNEPDGITSFSGAQQFLNGADVYSFVNEADDSLDEPENINTEIDLPIEDDVDDTGAPEVRDLDAAGMVINGTELESIDLPIEDDVDDIGTPEVRDLDAAGMVINGTELESVDDMEELLGRSRWCRRRRGVCRNPNKYRCPGGNHWSTKGRPYCMGKNRKCCYPRTKASSTTARTPPSTTPRAATTINPNITWISIGSDRFARFPQPMNWTAARSLCQSYGLDLYEPKDVTAVAIYLDNKFSDTHYWIGARGNGTYQIWLSGDIVPRSAPWYSNYYLQVSTDRCMEIITHSGWAAKNQSLAPVSCGGTWPDVICG